jgi:hypothetical protein
LSRKNITKYISSLFGVSNQAKQKSLAKARATWYEQVLDVCTIEATACRDGIKMAVQAGFQRVHLETDCLDVVQLWKRRGMQRSVIAPVLKEIVELSQGLLDFSFSFVNRVCKFVIK